MGRFSARVIVLSFALLGCGVNADQKPAQDACNAWCTSYAATAWPSDGSQACATPLYGSQNMMDPQAGRTMAAQDCRNAECVPLKGASAHCQTLLKDLYDCELAQPDLCADTGCNDQNAAVTTGCP